MINNKFLGAILILSGTCIGAGMLALPVTTAPAGFSYSILVLMVAWGFMYLTGLLVLEVNLWFKGEVSYISMAERTLGVVGKWFTWICFLLMLYALMAAYIMGGSAMVLTGLHWFTGGNIPLWVGIVPWVAVFAVVIYLGAGSVDFINKLIMLGLVVAFVVLLCAVAPAMHAQIHTQNHGIYLLAALPIIITSFGYHIVVPSMTTYLNRRTRKLKLVILIGSFVPLFVYLLWQWIVFAILPVAGSSGLLHILHHGDVSAGLTQALSAASNNNWLGLGVRFFGFFAIASSFIGVALGLFDLLSDGLQLRGQWGRLWVAVLTFIPPLLIAMLYPNGFIMTLSYAGVFVALLHGLLPALMAWSGRYCTGLAATGYRVFLGKAGLIVVMLISLLVVYAQVASNFHWIPTLQ